MCTRGFSGNIWNEKYGILSGYMIFFLKEKIFLSGMYLAVQIYSLILFLFETCTEKITLFIGRPDRYNSVNLMNDMWNIYLHCYIMSLRDDDASRRIRGTSHS